jgi:hypothetical protein
MAYSADTPTTIPPFQGQVPDAVRQWSQQPELYQHQLNVAQGVFYNDMQLTHEAMIYPGDAATLQSGMCVSVDPEDNLFHQGLVPGRIPFLAMPTGSYNGYVPTGNVYQTGICAIPTLQGMRVQTTEYDADGAPYLVNQPLTAFPPNHAKKGLIKHGENYVDTILGYVIEGITPWVASSPLGHPNAAATGTPGATIDLDAAVPGVAYQPMMKYVLSLFTWFLPTLGSRSVEDTTTGEDLLPGEET